MGWVRSLGYWDLYSLYGWHNLSLKYGGVLLFLLWVLWGVDLLPVLLKMHFCALISTFLIFIDVSAFR